MLATGRRIELAVTKADLDRLVANLRNHKSRMSRKLDDLGLDCPQDNEAIDFDKTSNGYSLYLRPKKNSGVSYEIISVAGD